MGSVLSSIKETTTIWGLTSENATSSCATHLVQPMTYQTGVVFPVSQSMEWDNLLRLDLLRSRIRLARKKLFGSTVDRSLLLTSVDSLWLQGLPRIRMKILNAGIVRRQPSYLQYSPVNARMGRWILPVIRLMLTIQWIEKKSRRNIHWWN